MTDLNAAAADATALTWPDPCCTKTVRLGKHWLFNPHWTSRCGLLDCFGDARGGPCFWNSTTDLNAAASNSTMPTWPDPGCKQLSGWENIGCSTLTGPPPAADSWMALETPGEGRATGTRRQTSTLLLQMLLQMLLQRLRRLLRTLPLDTAWVVFYVSQREPLHPGGVAWSRVCPDPGLASAPPPQAAEMCCVLCFTARAAPPRWSGPVTGVSRPGPGFGPSSAGSGETLHPLPHCVVLYVFISDSTISAAVDTAADAVRSDASDLAATVRSAAAAMDATATAVTSDASCSAATVRAVAAAMRTTAAVMDAAPAAVFSIASDVLSNVLSYAWTARCCLLDCSGDSLGGPCCWNSMTDLNTAASDAHRPLPVPSEAFLGRAGGGWANIGSRTLSPGPLSTISGMSWEQLRGMGCCPQVLLGAGSWWQAYSRHCARLILRQLGTQDANGPSWTFCSWTRGRELESWTLASYNLPPACPEQDWHVPPCAVAGETWGTDYLPPLPSPHTLHSHHTPPTPPSFSLPASRREAKLCSVTVHSVPHLRL